MSTKSAPPERVRSSAIVGAVIASIAASSCCIGPLVLTLLGVSGAATLTAFTMYRPYILGVTALFLGLGFYLTYRKPQMQAEDACSCERAKSRRASIVGLWMTTALTALIALAPPILSRIASLEKNASACTAGAKTEHATLLVEGMDCEACAVPIKTALQKTGGFCDLALDLAHRKITVTYEPAPSRLDAYVAAINSIGYEAKVGPRP